ncbi:hypothetical protein P9112_013827 [Eukaryota sp. TZLM1-RC]
MPKRRAKPEPPKVELCPHVDLIKETGAFNLQNVETRGDVSVLVDPVISKMSIRTRGTHSADTSIRFPKSPKTFTHSQRFLYIQYCPHSSFLISIDTESHSGSNFRTCVSSSIPRGSSPRVAPLCITYPTTLPESPPSWCQLAIDLTASTSSKSSMFEYKRLKSITIGGSISIRSIFLSDVLYSPQTPPPTVSLPPPPRSLTWKEFYTAEFVPRDLLQHCQLVSDPRTVRHFTKYAENGKIVGSIPRGSSFKTVSKPKPEVKEGPISSTCDDVALRIPHLFGLNPMCKPLLFPSNSAKPLFVLFSVGNFLFLKADDAPTSINFHTTRPVLSMPLAGPSLVVAVGGVSFMTSLAQKTVDQSRGVALTKEDRFLKFKIVSAHLSRLSGQHSFRYWDLSFVNDGLVLTSVKVISSNLGAGQVKISKVLDVSMSPSGDLCVISFVSSQSAVYLSILKFDDEIQNFAVITCHSLYPNGTFNSDLKFALKFNSVGNCFCVLCNEKIKTFTFKNSQLRSFSLSFEGTPINQVTSTVKNTRNQLKIIATCLDFGYYASTESLFIGTSQGHVYVSEYPFTTISIGFLLHQSPLSGLSFSNNLCLSGGNDGMVRVWPTRPEPFSSFYVEVATFSPVLNCQFTPDGRFGLVSSFDSISLIDLSTKSHSIIHSSPNTVTEQLPTTFNSFIDSVDNVMSCISANEGRGEIAVADFFENLKIFDLDTGSQLFEFIVPGSVSVSTFHPNRYELFCGTHDGYLYQFDVIKTSPIASLSVCEGNRIVDLSIKRGRDAEFVFVCDEKGNVYLIRPFEGVLRLLETFKTFDNPLFISNVFKSRYTLACSGDNSIRLYNNSDFKSGYQLEIGQHDGVGVFASSSSLVAIVFRIDCEDYDFVCYLFRIPASSTNSDSQYVFEAFSPIAVHNIKLPFYPPDEILVCLTPSCLNIVALNQLFVFSLNTSQLEQSPLPGKSQSPPPSPIQPSCSLILPSCATLMTSSTAAGHPILLIGDEVNCVCVVAQNVNTNRMVSDLKISTRVD